MTGFILFLHFFGLMLGAAGGFGSAIVLMRAQSAPAEQAQTLRALGPTLANVAGAGLLLLWITGIILVFTRGGAGQMPGLFWVKLFFVVVATILLGLIHMTYAQMRRTGDASLARRLFIFGPGTSAAVLIAVLLAAYAFH